ncbi:MAG: hypothetical protein ASARMPREDX12_000232 [Alectoria sarmentosa]|nr:MAG: hypothetical protein ASARMPREDX12_000232 [Alectoria sarmentosa]
MISHIIITSCTIADGPAIARNNIPAFWTDSTWVLIWPGKTCEYVTAQAARRMAATLLKDPAHVRHQKAINAQSGAIFGYVRWVLPCVDDENAAGSGWIAARVPAVSEAQQHEAERERDAADWEYDHALDDLDEQMLDMKRRLMDGKRYMLLDYLAVHPDNRGQGIGSMLVQNGIREARKLGLDVFVHGMKAGLGVYKRTGFRLVDQMILNDSEYGGKGEYGSYFLVNEAEKGNAETEEEDEGEEGSNFTKTVEEV